MTTTSFTIDLPDWLKDRAGDEVVLGDDDRMAYVIDLARRNVAEETGGPFGAAIFEIDTGRLVAAGVNRVMPISLSMAHAEIVAIGLASTTLGTFDLGAEGLPAMEVVASTEPCAMCMGATIWSGVRSLRTGARDEDARSVGFDEGPKVDDWQGELTSRGITVVCDVLRAEAAAVLRAYAESGATIYNGRQDA